MVHSVEKAFQAGDDSLRKIPRSREYNQKVVVRCGSSKVHTGDRYEMQ